MVVSNLIQVILMVVMAIGIVSIVTGISVFVYNRLKSPPAVIDIPQEFAPLTQVQEAIPQEEEIPDQESPIPLNSTLKRRIYESFMAKGPYPNEQRMLADAFMMLDWGLNKSRDGWIILSQDTKTGEVREFSIETLDRIRERMANPLNFLNKCMDMEPPAHKKEDKSDHPPDIS